MNRVLNKFPTLEAPYRIAIIGGSPEEADELNGEPFVSSSGRLLHAVLSQVQIMKGACFLGNVNQTRSYDIPQGNSLDWTPAISKAELKSQLNEFKPNIVILLGNEALAAASIPHPVDSFRGSLFEPVDEASPFYGHKCIATYDPSLITKVYENLPLFALDLKRALSQGFARELVLPKRRYEVELTATQICDRLDGIADGTWTSVDIEGGVEQGITCIGVATSPFEAFIVNPLDFSVSERVRILQSIGRVLMSDRIPKVLQNSLYDNFCLSYVWKMPIRNVVFDTMLSGWELYPELPKGLGTQTSIYTLEPYYKFQRKVDDKLTHYRYCCTDACVTLEIALKHLELMTEAEKQSFNFNMSLLPACNYMQLKGIRYDKEKAKTLLEEVQAKMAVIQGQIDSLAKHPLNPNSPKQMSQTLYKELGFPPQYKKEKGRRTTSTTTDVEALLTLVKHDNTGIIYHILNWRALDSQRKQLEITTDADGRVRCAYNIVGTETGRFTCYESNSGSGTNLQTIMAPMRVLYLADENKYFAKCDLSGADGWTVAAHSAALGDETLIKDYRAGIKPARVLALLYLAGTNAHKLAYIDQDAMLEEISKIEIPKMLYETCKMIQHGSSYMMKERMMSTNILKQSWKKSGIPIYESPQNCGKLQHLFLNYRYKGIVRYQEHVARTVTKTKKITDASGHTRTFFGRENDDTTIRAACSHEPQANTTYATKLALYRLWHDPENRRPDNSLIIEPLHQVHDEMDVQFDQSLEKWACNKLISYFNNPLTIAGQQITIPFEGAYGPSWGDKPFAIKPYDL